MIGQTISHYRIIEKLGEGGMGVVYKAEDTTLDRPVALKFLAAHLVSDEETRKRFEREAKAAAGLNHPNICTVYEIAEDNARTFIAMAFLEGEGLDKKIEAGPLKLKDALDIAIQTAQGLQAAHEKGIVHRDIKPANLMVTGSGSKRLVTIMDFGLAQLADRSKLTRMDETMGTVTYMSPEQTYGADIDHRSDVWSLGVVLYEMVTGQQPFKGHYDKAVMYSITNEEPEPMTGLRTGVPMELELLVNKCLTKEADRRYQSTADMVVDLETLSEKLKSGKSTIVRTGAPVGADTPAGPSDVGARVVSPVGQTIVSGQAQAGLPVAPAETGARATAQGRLAWLVAAICLLAAVYFATAYFRVPLPEAKTVRYQMPPPPETDYYRGAAISPDGRLVAFAAREGQVGSRLWVRRLDSLTAQPLEGTDMAVFPFWSPDSEYIGYFAESKLKRVAASGGPSITLADVNSSSGGTWNPDGLILFSVASASDGALYQVPAAGGVPKPVTELDHTAVETEHLWPHFLPGGRHFLYLAVSDGRDYQELRVGTLDGAEPEPLQAANTRVEYAAGHLLFISGDTLMAQPFEPSRREIIGDPFPVAEGVGYAPNEYSGYFSSSADGILIYESAVQGFWPLHWFDRSGNRLASLGSDNFAGGHAEISPDGKRVAFDIADPGALNRDIWIRDLERGINSRLTFDGAIDWVPIWSPDGSHVVFASDRDNSTHQLYQKDSSGAGEAEALLRSEEPKHHMNWSPDGQFIAYESGPPGNYDLWVLPLSGERKPYSFLATQFMETQPQFSPDGRWLAYASNETGRYEVYIRGFDKAEGGKWQISTGGGVQPRWKRDGKELYYLAADGKLMAAPMKPASSRPGAGIPEALFQTQLQGTSSIAHYAATAGGEEFLLAAPSDSEESVPITVVLNWNAEFRDRRQN